jgi:hypothetical protein
MNFDRLRFQSWIENEVGCSDLLKWESYKSKLELFKVDSTKIDAARIELGADAVSLYTKALISCCSGIQDASNSQMGWGLVKLYYSLFYSSRSNLCARQQGLIRNKSWFRFDLTSIDKNCIRVPQKYRNDHEAALYLYEDLYGSSDKLLSNTVDNKKPYEWMMETRNLVNYRLAHFSDPLLPPNIQTDIEFHTSKLMITTLDSYINDTDNRLTFQPEHAWLAIPFKQILQSREGLRLRKLKGVVSLKQSDHLKKMMTVLPDRARKALDIDGFLEISDGD